MPYTSAESGYTDKERSITLKDLAGNTETRIGGHRNWRNNNPGNLISGSFAAGQGAIGKDYGGMAIFPDMDTGGKAMRALIKQKWGDSPIREMLKGKFDDKGKFIPGTGYAPSVDGNDPDKYADHVKERTGLDVEKKKISELSDDDLKKLQEAMKKEEGMKEGRANAGWRTFFQSSGAEFRRRGRSSRRHAASTRRSNRTHTTPRSSRDRSEARSCTKSSRGERSSPSSKRPDPYSSLTRRLAPVIELASLGVRTELRILPDGGIPSTLEPGNAGEWKR